MSNCISAPVLVLGAGIGGLVTALACSQQKIPTVIWEKSLDFKELGAGIQLGPNATKVLAQMGLAQELKALASVPQKLVFYNAKNGSTIFQRELASKIEQQFGAPYYTIARADLHELLLSKVQNNSWCEIHTGQSFESLAIDTQNPLLVQANNTSGARLKASAVIGVDGARSATRNYFYPDQDLHFTGQIAYRALLDSQQIASQHLLQQVSVWLGAQVHVVAYPVLQGRFLNIVVIAEELHLKPEMQLWHKQLIPQLPANIIDLVAKNQLLSKVFQAIENWRYWLLFDRPPLSSAQLMLGSGGTLESLKAVGQRVALLGDAAHPMLPFLAQGAAMAIEDAYTLSLQLAKINRQSQATASGVPQALQQYANLRWQRVAKVQSLARRNSAIFHWQGLMAQCRNMGLAIVGQPLTEMAWLYGHEIK